MRKIFITTDSGTEKLCPRCQDYWPATPEFFWKKGEGLHSYCKACFSERQAELKAGAPRKHHRRTSAEIQQSKIELYGGMNI